MGQAYLAGAGGKAKDFSRIVVILPGEGLSPRTENFLTSLVTFFFASCQTRTGASDGSGISVCYSWSRHKLGYPGSAYFGEPSN